MEEDNVDLSIEVKFESVGGVPAEVLSAVLDLIARAVWRVEEEELEAFVKQSDAPPALHDAMRYRLREVRPGMSFHVEAASTGSIILAGAAAGLAYWIADKTLGETLKQAWVESPAHTALKDFFNTRLLRKKVLLADEISRASHRPIPRSYSRRYGSGSVNSFV